MIARARGGTRGVARRRLRGGALARFVTLASHQQVEIGPWGHGGGSFADTLRPSGALEHDPLSTGSQRS